MEQSMQHSNQDFNPLPLTPPPLQNTIVYHFGVFANFNFAVFLEIFSSLSLVMPSNKMLQIILFFINFVDIFLFFMGVLKPFSLQIIIL